MLKMALLGLLILLSAGVLSAMELNAPPRRTVAIAQPPAEPSAGTSASHDPLPKADRLEVTAVSSAMPQDIHGLSTPRQVVRHRRDAKTVATAERPKPKPKAMVAKRAAHAPRTNAASATEPCRLKAFGGLLKALNLTGCEI